MYDLESLTPHAQAAASQDFFFNVFKQSPSGMAIVCPRTLTFQAVNDRFGAMTGFAPDRLVDGGISTLIAEDAISAYSEGLRNLSNGTVPSPLVRKVAYKRPDECASRFTETVTAITAPASEPGYLLISIEETSGEAGINKLLSAFLEHTTDEIWAVTQDNRLLLANREFSKRHNIRSAHIGAPNSADLIPNRSSAEMSMQRAVLETGQTRRQMLSHTLPDGHTEMYAMVKFPLDLAGDGKIAVGTIATNISDISKSAKAIRDRDDQIRHITDSLHVLIFRLDEDLKFKYMNRSGSQWLKISPEDVIGKSYAEVLGPEIFEQRRPFVEQALEGKVVTHTAVSTYPDGNTRHVNVTFVPHRAAPGRPYGLIGLAEDVTERKRIEDQLARASKMEGIGQLAAGIAHEINTPIQYIGDNLGFLNDASRALFELVPAFTSYIATAEAGGDLSEAKGRVNDAIDAIDLDFLKEDVPDAIERSLQGVKEVARIVLSMKDFSHPNNKERTPVNINKSLQNTLIISRNERKQVADVEEDLAEKLPAILGFPGELNQVFLNLIINAAQAIAEKDVPGRGIIRVSTREIEDRVEIRISDTGTGIPEALRERIFEPFFTTKDVGKGTGQGLAISWDIIVGKHGGTIDIESVEGEGTTFILTLPIS
jgi:PAS domain S-box-containing protein